MKQVGFISFVLITVLIFSSCNGLKKMQKNQGLITYKVTPEVLEMHADTVAFTIDGKFPAKYFSKKAVAVITPVIKYKNGEKALTPITVQGEKVQANDKVINFTDGGSFTYTDKAPYVDDMKISELLVNIKASVKSKSVDLDPKKVADGVIATPKLLVSDPRPIMLKDQFVRITPEVKEADINFALQQANVRPGELSQQDIKDLKSYINSVLQAENKELKGISVSAYASPDGPEDLNTKISGNRGTETEKYIGNEIKNTKAPKTEEKDKAKIKEAKDKFDAKVKSAQDKGLYTTASTAEDWDGFKRVMEATDIPDKDLVLRVLSMYSDPEVREKEIKNLSKVYLSLADKILPQLRRSVLKINVDVVGKSDEEIAALADSQPDSLNVEELLYAASLTTDLNKQLSIYKSCQTVFPNEYRGFNNTGYTYIKLGKTSEAKQAFEGAKKIKDGDAVVMNNLGVIAYTEDDLTKAEEFYKSASGAGNEVNYNLGLIAVRRANYEDAVKYFGGDCSFNAALAKVLNKDTDGASKTIDCISDKEQALNYYLKAIIGAKTANTDILFNNLRSAVAKDASLGAKAKMDMEFGKYFQDSTFLSIVGN